MDHQYETITEKTCLCGLRSDRIQISLLGLSPGRVMCFFLPCDICWLSMALCPGCEQQRDCLVGFWHGSEQIRGQILAGGNCNRPNMWPDSSVVRRLARSARGPWFESRSGHVLSSPVTCKNTDKLHFNIVESLSDPVTQNQ